MKALIFIIILFFSGWVLACAPAMPNFRTEEAMTCGKKCQSMYAGCNSVCTGSYHISSSKCFDRCSRNLDNCYAACE